MEAQNAGNTEIAVILLVMAPADQMPAECIKNESDGLHFPDRNLFKLIGISNFQNLLRSDGLLNAGQIVKILNETDWNLELYIGGQPFNRILLGRTQHGFYFGQRGGIMLLDGFVRKSRYNGFH